MIGTRVLNEVLQEHRILLCVHLAAASEGLRLRLAFKLRYDLARTFIARMVNGKPPTC